MACFCFAVSLGCEGLSAGLEFFVEGADGETFCAVVGAAAGADVDDWHKTLHAQTASRTTKMQIYRAAVFTAEIVG